VLTIIHNLAEDVVVVDGSTLRKTATLMSDDRSERLDPASLDWRDGRAYRTRTVAHELEDTIVRVNVS